MQSLASGVVFRSRLVEVSPQATPTKQVSIHVVLQDLNTNCGPCKSLKDMQDASFVIAMKSFLVGKNHYKFDLTIEFRSALRMTSKHKSCQAFFLFVISSFQNWWYIFISNLNCLYSLSFLC